MLTNHVNIVYMIFKGSIERMWMQYNQENTALGTKDFDLSDG